MYSLSAFLLLGALAALKLQPVRAQQETGSPAYIGCLESSYVPATYDYEKYTYDAETCATECYADYGTVYSYFQAYVYARKRSLDGQTLPDSLSKRADNPGTCYCSNDAPTPAVYVNAANTDGSSACNSGNFQAFVTTSTFAFQGCFSEFASDEVTRQLGISDQEGCFEACETDAQAIFMPYPSGSYCFCGDSTATGMNAETCADGSMFFYEHTAGTYVVSPSSFVKRQLRERLLRGRQARQAICPGALTACNVAGDSFECLDTTSELESCGGCINGDFNNINGTTVSSGTDCTSLPGVALGAVTCASGACQVSACKNGWVLSNGGCVRS